MSQVTWRIASCKRCRIGVVSAFSALSPFSSGALAASTEGLGLSKTWSTLEEDSERGQVVCVNKCSSIEYFRRRSLSARYSLCSSLPTAQLINVFESLPLQGTNQIQMNVSLIIFLGMLIFRFAVLVKTVAIGCPPSHALGKPPRPITTSAGTMIFRPSGRVRNH